MSNGKQSSDQRSQCVMCGKPDVKRIIKTDSGHYKVCKECDEAMSPGKPNTATERPVQS